MVFETLDKKIVKWLEENGFLEATLPQKLAIPEIAKGKNVLVMAPTGMGKTEASLLAIFDKMLRTPELPGIRLLYVTPLKSLNRDIFDRVIMLANKLDIEVDIRHGDTPPKIRSQQLSHPADMMIITPEALQSIIIGKKFREILKNVEWVIIDEIHELADNKRGAQLMVALERLEKLCGRGFQRIGLSATIGDPKKISEYLVGDRDCKFIDAASEKAYEISIEKPLPTVEDMVLSKKMSITANTAYCLRRIKELVDENRSTIIFVNTRETAESLGSRFKNWIPDFKIAVHHSSLSKDVRIEVEKKFKNREINAIVSTSSLELGIDIGSIDLVIQYGSPRQVSKLVQRVGRSGHGIGRKSKGVLICNSMDDYLEAAAILQKSKQKWLEFPKIPDKPWDVLCHQIIGICIDLEQPSFKQIWELTKRAYPFREMTKEELEKLLKLMEDIYLVGRDKENYYRTRRGLLYYFANLSMIPNEKNFLVINKELNKKIGVLHQGFVAQYIKRGVEFIMKGEPWKVVEKGEETVDVIPGSSIESAVPSWEGELIPVSKEVANLASDLRHEFEFEDLKTQAKNFVVPDSKTIFVESFEDYVIVHCAFGSKINATLAKAIGVLITSKIGRSVGDRSDVYRLIFKMPEMYGRETVLEALHELRPEYVKEIIGKSIKNMAMLEFRFFQVAKRFGIIDRDTQFSSSMLSRLIETYQDSPVFEETLHEIYREKLDITGAEEVVSAICNKKIEVVDSSGYDVSPLGVAGLDYGAISLIKAKENISEIMDIIKSRILKRRFWFYCLTCKNELGTFAVSNVPEELRCSCGAKLIAFAPVSEEAEIKKVLKKYQAGDKLDEQEGKMLKKFEETAELFINYGNKSVFVMAGYGIGPTTAKRILGKMHKTENELLRDIIAAERQFISTRVFW